MLVNYTRCNAALEVEYSRLLFHFAIHPRKQLNYFVVLSQFFGLKNRTSEPRSYDFITELNCLLVSRVLDESKVSIKEHFQ